MSSDLFKVHTCDVYSWTVTQDDLMGNVETLGTQSAADVASRWVPLSARQRVAYDVAQEVEGYMVCFPEDASLDTTKALVWNSKVWRIREYRDGSGGTGMVYHAIVEHVPKVEVSAP